MTLRPERSEGPASRPFLTAEWCHLMMLNYRVDASLIENHVPAGTSLDFHEGQTYVSLVGFLFRDTRVLGVPIPWHRTFEELNLRVYVKRVVDGNVRRGVTFIRELVPRRAIATVARLAYNEPYESVPMRHRIESSASTEETRVEYSWRYGKRWNSMAVRASGAPQRIAPGTLQAFITEHYWGYTRQRDGGTVEYQVTHEPWSAWHVTDTRLDADTSAMYGPTLGSILRAKPDSVILAQGSPVAVYSARRL